MFSTCGLRPALALLISSRQAGLRAAVGAAHVDAEHQVEALHRRGRRRRQADGAGVVDQDVDAAEARHRLLHRGGHAGLVADVALQRQRLAAGGLDLGRGAEWIVPGSLGLGSVVLASDHDVGAVARGALGDGQADAAAGAGDEEGLALQVSSVRSPVEWASGGDVGGQRLAAGAVDRLAGVEAVARPWPRAERAVRCRHVRHVARASPPSAPAPRRGAARRRRPPSAAAAAAAGSGAPAAAARTPRARTPCALRSQLASARALLHGAVRGHLVDDVVDAGHAPRPRRPASARCALQQVQRLRRGQAGARDAAASARAPRSRGQRRAQLAGQRLVLRAPRRRRRPTNRRRSAAAAAARCPTSPCARARRLRAARGARARAHRLRHQQRAEHELQRERHGRCPASSELARSRACASGRRPGRPPSPRGCAAARRTARLRCGWSAGSASRCGARSSCLASRTAPGGRLLKRSATRRAWFTTSPAGSTALAMPHSTAARRR